MEKLTLEEAIERIGFGRFQIKLLFICGASWAADAMEVLIISFVIPALMKEWKLSTVQAGFLGTATFLGMLVGAWFWGTISDYIGRRLGFQLTILVDSLFGFLSALAPNFPLLVLFRALTGFGVGGTLPVDYSIFAEYLPRKKRGHYLVILESFWAIGSIIAAGLAWLIVPKVGWRTLLAVSALPGVIVYFIRRYVPESPRYLLISGREEEARRVLEQVAKENGVEVEIPGLVVETRRTRVTVSALWRGNLLPVTLMLWIVWFTISLGYYGVFIWLPKILVARGFTFLQTYANVFLMSLAQLPGYFSAAYLVERWGRRPTLVFYMVMSGLFTYLFAVATELYSILESAILMSFFCLGAWGCLYAYTPELYPTEVRATGMGWASGMTRIAGAIAPTLGAYLLSISLTAALTLYALSFLLGGLTTAVLGRETKGQPLMEVVK